VIAFRRKALVRGFDCFPPAALDASDLIQLGDVFVAANAG
jgi:hypothetical protein